MAEKIFTSAELYEAWPVLSLEERVEGFEFLKRDDADDFFLQLNARDRAELLLALPPGERRLWMRLLAPDDAADVIQEAPAEERESMLSLLDDQTRREVKGLLDYAEDEAGGLMNTRYSRLRADMTDVISAPEDLDQEALSQLFIRHHLLMMPVVDAEGRIKGVVNVNDIVDVVQEEATEDIQKLGAVETLQGPYLQVPLPRMIRKRAGWLAALFLGEMLTATAMGQFEAEIAHAVVLALFVPLIISSGGNSGAQATTLVIRAMALGEVRLRDWWRVIRREVITGFGLGTILASIGMVRILLWQFLFDAYGAHYFLVALTVAFSLVGVVLWGSVAGSILPFILRGLGFDPASASAPFVATLVDVTGLVIYFSIAAVVLNGTLL